MDTTQTVKNLLDLSQGIDRGVDDYKAHAMAEEMSWQIEGLVEALAKGGPIPDWKAIWKQMRT